MAGLRYASKSIRMQGCATLALQGSLVMSAMDAMCADAGGATAADTISGLGMLNRERSLAAVTVS
jgi:hypothetical protein